MLTSLWFCSIDQRSVGSPRSGHRRKAVRELRRAAGRGRGRERYPPGRRARFAESHGSGGGRCDLYH